MGVRPFEVSNEQIEALDDTQLTRLALRLLRCEAERAAQPTARIECGVVTDAPDGGEDALIELNGELAGGEWIPRASTLFQIKATKMGPKDCKEEVWVGSTAKDGLTSRVERIVNRKGAYVLFYGKPLNGKMTTAREQAIRQGLEEAHGEGQHVAVVVLDATKIARWVNCHLTAVLYVLEQCGHSPPASLLTFEEWLMEWDAQHPDQLTFVAGTREPLIQELRSALSEGGGRSFRLLGLSGLGKSRLALEVFSDPQLRETVAYVADGADRARDLEDNITDMRRRGVQGVLVVDECPNDLHEKLTKKINYPNSKLSILTLDFDPSMKPVGTASIVHVLAPLPDQAVSEIVKRTDPGLAHIADAIAEMCQGYPRMAQLVLGAFREDEHLWELGDSRRFSRLIVRRSAQDTEGLLRVARGLAVLEHVGIAGEDEYQLEYFAKHLCDGLQTQAAFARIRELERAGIAYRRGDLIRLTPLPLAIVLASEWWDMRSEQTVRSLLVEGALPAFMASAMLNRLVMLKGHPVVEPLIDKVLGPASPFRTWEYLSSAEGSRLVLTLAEASPVRVMGALRAVFGGIGPEEARQIAAGRRNLVWALEKLAWWPETFFDASRLLLALAAGENETCTNNATGQFATLFQLYLAGTEVPASSRVEVLKTAVRSEDPHVQAAGVAALKSVFQTDGFTRTGGVERQAGQLPREDWRPTTYTEMWDYWSQVLDVFDPILRAEDGLGPEARKNLGRSGRGVARLGGLAVLTRVDELIEDGVRDWPDLKERLESLLHYDSEIGLPDEILSTAKDIIEKLEPRSVEERIQAIVSTPSWSRITRIPDGGHVLESERRARAFADEFRSNPEELRRFLPLLLRGEQRQAWSFAVQLAPGLKDPVDWIASCFRILADTEPEERNPALPMGIASARRELSGPIREALAKHLQDPGLSVVAAEVIRASGLDSESADLLRAALVCGSLPVRWFENLRLGAVTRALTVAEFDGLVRACVRADPASDGARVALGLLSLHTHREQLPSELAQLAVDVLIAACTNEEPGSSLDAYEFEQLALKTTDAGISDESYSKLLRALLVRLSSAATVGEAVNSVRALLGARPELGWQALVAAVGGDSTDGLRLSYRLGGLSGGGVDLFELFGEDRIRALLDENPEHAVWIAKLTKPLDADGPSGWTPGARLLLDHYSSSKVLSTLYGNLIGVVWVRSEIPLLQRRQLAFQDLLTWSRSEATIDWAKAHLESTRARLEYVRKREEEEEFGVLRF